MVPQFAHQHWSVRVLVGLGLELGSYPLNTLLRPHCVKCCSVLFCSCRYTLSTPYLDSSGAGLVITLSHTIRKANYNSDIRDAGGVAAVMGIDFTLDRFAYVALLENVRPTAYCVLVTV